MAYKITQERGIGAVTGNIAWIPIQPLVATGRLIFVAALLGLSVRPGGLPVESPA